MRDSQTRDGSGSARQRSARAVLCVLILYAATRLYHLTVLPVFLDESLHVVWSFRVADEGRLGRPLAAGKALMVWLASLVTPYASNPLWAARALSVLMGGVAAWAAYDVGRRLYGGRTALMAGLLYVVCPFALFHDRMVLADVYLSAFAGLTLVMSIQLVRRPSLGASIALAAALVLAVLAKMLGVALFLVPVMAALLLRPQVRIARALSVAFAIALALLAYPIWYFASHTAEIEEKSVLAGGRGLDLNLAVRNLTMAGTTLWDYWTPALFLLGVAAAIYAIVRKDRRSILLVLCASVPVLLICATARSWYPRYFLFATIPLLVLVAAFLVRLADLALARLPTAVAIPALVVAALAVVVPAAHFDWLLVSHPERAPLPDLDRVQYVEGWASGYGVPEAARYIEGEARRASDGIAIVGHANGSRAPYLGLRTYLLREERVAFAEADLTRSDEVERLRIASRPTFVVLPGPDGPGSRPDEATLRRAALHTRSFYRPSGALALELIEIAPAGTPLKQSEETK